MTALYRGGRQGDALALYRGTRRFLVAELGVEPGGGLRTLPLPAAPPNCSPTPAGS